MKMKQFFYFKIYFLCVRDCNVKPMSKTTAYNYYNNKFWATERTFRSIFYKQVSASFTIIYKRMPLQFLSQVLLLKKIKKARNKIQ